jgi:SHS family lactate transporter-like MFS transporter
MIALCLLGGILVIPAWAFAPSLPILILGAFLIQFCVQGAWGVIPAHIMELSPDGVRGFLPGFAYQCGVAIAGSVVYVEAFFTRYTTYAWSMALTAATVFTFASVTAMLGKERRGRVYGGDADAAT